jgi:hypothetical protein
MSLPSTGELKFSRIRSTFGTAFTSLSSMYRTGNGVATSGTIKMSQLRGISVSVPSIRSVPTQSFGTGNSSQWGSIFARDYVTDTYGSPLTYSTSWSWSGWNVNPRVRSSDSYVDWQVAYNRWVNVGYIYVNVTNRFGRSGTITIPIYSTGIPLSVSGMGSTTLTTNTRSWSMTSYYSDWSGTGISFWMHSNPRGNAWLSGSTLYVEGANRGTSYSVGVGIGNGYGQTGVSWLSVREESPPPPPPEPVSSHPPVIGWKWQFGRSGTVNHTGRLYMAGLGRIDAEYRVKVKPFMADYIYSPYTYRITDSTYSAPDIVVQFEGYFKGHIFLDRNDGAGWYHIEASWRWVDGTNDTLFFSGGNGQTGP